MMINEKVVLDFFEFIYDRQLIYWRKVKENPHPLTTDKILSTYKFCNIYRQNDKCTRYLMDTVINNKLLNNEQKLFWIIFYRRFNLFAFWSLFGPQFRLECKPNFIFMKKKLEEAKSYGKKIFNEAYTLCQVPYNKDLPHIKHIQILASMKDIYDCKFLEYIPFDARALFDYLHFKGATKGSHGIGDFLSYQILQDFSYIKDVDIIGLKDFTFVGPGAAPSIYKIYSIQKDATSPPTKEELCLDLARKQKIFFSWLKSKRKKDWKKVNCPNLDDKGFLSVHNIQASLCEFRKYSNLKSGFGRRRKYHGV